jgi:hypothetical protein
MKTLKTLFNMKTAFSLNFVTILFFLANGIVFGFVEFYAIAIVFLAFLPVCSKTN